MVLTPELELPPAPHSRYMVVFPVMCAILGHNTAFSVKTDGNEPVSELKNKILQANPTTLASFEASALKLHIQN